MNIDFPPPSKNGVYNNAGSSRRLANYLEHEDLERMEQGIYTDGFFNLKENDIYKSRVIKEIDSNARNFNKGLSAEDIKFFGKIHFSRDRSENKHNMHCHLIISRKDQSNKKKLSPLTNHKNTKKGVIKGGFDRANLFRQAEIGFDRLFDHNRPLTESFEYYNTMKNGSLTDQLKMQEREPETNEIPFAGEKKNTAKVQTKTDLRAGLNISMPQQTSEDALSSLFSILPLDDTFTDNQQQQQPRKKKKRRKGFKK
jgi:ribosomal protein S15P/S13E